MKRLLLLSLALTALAAGKIEIQAQRFETDESRGMTLFTGNVIVTRGEDVIRAERIEVFTDGKNEISRFEADGNTTFTLSLDANKTFRGHAGKFLYQPEKKEYLLTGGAVVEDVAGGRKIIGETIRINEEKKQAQVSGGEKKPVRLILTIDDEKKGKKEKEADVGTDHP